MKVSYGLAYVGVMWIYYVSVNGGVRFPMPVNVFLAYQVLQFTGTVLHADIGVRPYDLVRMSAMILGTSILVIGAAMANRRCEFSPLAEFRAYQKRPLVFDIRGGIYWWLVLLMGVVGCAVGGLFVYALGFNAPFELVKTYLQNGGDLADTAVVYGTLRTTLGRELGERYIAPGFAAQFITVLLPLSFYLLYFRALLLKRGVDRVLAAVFLIACIYLMTASGIRSYIVIFAVTYLLLSSRRYGPLCEGDMDDRKKSGTILPRLVITLAGISFFAFTFMGRRGGDTDPLWKSTLIPFYDFFDRLVFVSVDNQFLAMDYFRARPFGWGLGWIQSLSNIVPRGMGREILHDLLGVSSEHGGDLSLEIYRVLYGGDGSAPLDMWSSIWLEFGWPGTLIVPLFVGYFLQKFTIWFVRGDRSVTRHVITVMSAFALMNLFEPMALFLGGFFTLMLFLQLTKLVKMADWCLLRDRDQSDLTVITAEGDER
ncbi:MAG: oligosaccharide repeat unit polymerase [Proteobacteria bacterium]|nr:oligosaccharide repeat unit polymerase [Pseudomonadota bacterium]